MACRVVSIWGVLDVPGWLALSYGSSPRLSISFQSCLTVEERARQVELQLSRIRLDTLTLSLVVDWFVFGSHNC
jgi:hypothetical protein